MSSSTRSRPDPRNHLLAAIVGDEAVGRESAPALFSAARVLSYADLARAAERGAREIDERFPPGSRVLVAAYDQMVVALALLSALRSQSVPLLVDPQSSSGLARVARRWGVAGGLGDSTILDSLDAVIDETAVLGWAESDGRGGAELPAVRFDDPAFWTFTSGTTGEPRAVVHAHRGPLAAYEAFGRDVLSLASADRTASTAGLPFVYALGNNLFFPLFAGGAAILPADLLLPTVLAEVRRHAATVLVSGPWSLEAMARLAGRSDRGDALRRLRLVLSAGEPLAASVFSRWQSTFGQTPLDNLGCTEMFNSFLSSHPEDAAPGSLGHVVPGFEVRLDGQPPVAGRRGALTVRGESRAVAMSGDDGGDEILGTDGAWCETGDELEVDETGRFTYLGRLDDRFKVRGQFVRPAEVERRLRGLEGVRECLVSPDIDRHGLACVSVRLVLERGSDTTEVLRTAGAAARDALPAAARTLRFERVEALPRSPRGKMLRERRAASS